MVCHHEFGPNRVACLRKIGSLTNGPGFRNQHRCYLTISASGQTCGKNHSSGMSLDANMLFHWGLDKLSLHSCMIVSGEFEKSYWAQVAGAANSGSTGCS